MVAAADCPALFFCAPASGQGKTTITAAIARYHKNLGRDVRVFKTGPDYLDPLILERACGNPVVQLDLWMVGEQECKQLIFEAAQIADLILVEGVMGMFDGNPSSADMAAYFDIPIAIIIDARSMAQTFAAIALGLTQHRAGLKIAGCIANNISSDRHQQLIEDAMPEAIPGAIPEAIPGAVSQSKTGAPKLLGCVRRHPDHALPQRHLGLVHPHEIDDIDKRLDALADIMHTSGLTSLPQPVCFKPANITPPTAAHKSLKGKTIAIAKDDAFTFIYAANIQLLESMGARCIDFSPTQDHKTPAADALWLPGGYPELHMEKLSRNLPMANSIKHFYAAGKPILAECGGMLYLMETLTDVAGNSANMLGLLAGHGVMRERGGCQGMQTAPLPEGEIRAHAHHRTQCEKTIAPIAHGKRTHHPAPGEPIYRQKNLTASYLHLYFPSNPQAIALLFKGELQ